MSATITVTIKPQDVVVTVPPLAGADTDAKHTVKDVVAALVAQEDHPEYAPCVLTTYPSGNMAKNTDVVEGATFTLAMPTEIAGIGQPIAFPTNTTRDAVLKTFLYHKDKLTNRDALETAKGEYQVFDKTGKEWADADDATLEDKGFPRVLVVQRRMYVKVAGHRFEVCGSTTVGELRDMVAEKLGRPRSDIRFKAEGIGRDEFIGVLTAAHATTTSGITVLQHVTPAALKTDRQAIEGIATKAKMKANSLKAGPERTAMETYAKTMSSLVNRAPPRGPR